MRRRIAAEGRYALIAVSTTFAGLCSRKAGTKATASRAAIQGADHGHATDVCLHAGGAVPRTERRQRGRCAVVSHPADQDHRCGRAGRAVRFAGPSGGANPAVEARATRGRREPWGCGWRDRRAGGGECSARRLHADDRQHQHAGGDPCGIRQRRLRSGQGLRSDRQGYGGLPDPGRASVIAMEIDQGAGGLFQGQSGQGQLRAYRRRRAAASRRRAFHVAQWRENDRRLLSQRRGVRRPQC